MTLARSIAFAISRLRGRQVTWDVQPSTGVRVSGPANVRHARCPDCGRKLDFALTTILGGAVRDSDGGIRAVRCRCKCRAGFVVFADAADPDLAEMRRA